jgi:hypothetical protein
VIYSYIPVGNLPYCILARAIVIAYKGAVLSIIVIDDSGVADIGMVV